MTTNHTAQAILEALEADQDATGEALGRVTIALAVGDTAWNPGSTKRLIDGPTRVRYTLWPDGGVDAYLEV